MKKLFLLFIIFVSYLEILNAKDTNLYIKNCQSCHGNSPGKTPLSFEQISIDFSKEEFTEYLKYEDGKFSVHNTILNNNSKDTKLLKASSLDFHTRVNIMEFIFEKHFNSQCMW
jgi:hypothetical protein